MPRLAWRRFAWRSRSPVYAGFLVLALLVAISELMPQSWRTAMAESALDRILVFDNMLRSVSATAPRPVVVVDIDHRSIEELGPWPWPRDRMARLIAELAAAKPQAIGVDVLFSDS